MYRILLIFTICFIGLSLNVWTQPYKAGIYKDTITSSIYPDQTYGLYIPGGLSINGNYGIIYFFGSDDNSKSILQEYKQLADDYLMVLVNIHINSNHFNSVDRLESVYKETHKLIPLDKNNEFTAGLGSSVELAFKMAIRIKEIRGVIGINMNENAVDRIKNEYRRDLEFISIVGRRSYSYYKKQMLDDFFDTYKLKHKSILYNGNSDWPSVSDFEMVIDWIKFENSKTDPSNHVEYLAARYQNEFARTIRMDDNEPTIALYNYEQIIEEFQGIFSMSAVESRIKLIKSSKAFKQDQRIEAKIRSKELD